MNLSNVLQQFASAGSTVDAAKTPSQRGYLKRVTPVLPKSANSELPAGATAGSAATDQYVDNGAGASPRYTLKDEYAFTYTAPAGAKVVGPGVSSPAASIPGLTVKTRAAYPMCIVVFSGDGSEFLLNLSSPETTSESSDPETIARETSVAYVPVNRTLFFHLASSDWETGSADDFADGMGDGADAGIW